MAWNIQEGGGTTRGPAVAAAVEAVDPDVVVLSEWSPVRSEVEASLAGRWPHSESVHTSTGPSAGMDKRWGLLMRSKVPVTRKTVDAPPSAPASWLEVEVPSAGLVVAGVRVLSPVVGTPFEPSVYWRWLLTQAERLSKTNAVLLGDFNVVATAIGGRRDPGVKTLLLHGWKDTVGDVDGDAKSFFNRSGAAPVRNDFAFTSPLFTGSVVRASHPLVIGDLTLSGPKGSGDRISDHAPLVLELDV